MLRHPTRKAYVRAELMLVLGNATKRTARSGFLIPMTSEDRFSARLDVERESQIHFFEPLGKFLFPSPPCHIDVCSVHMYIMDDLDALNGYDCTNDSFIRSHGSSEWKRACRIRLWNRKSKADPLNLSHPPLTFLTLFPKSQRIFKKCAFVFACAPFLTSFVS